MASIIKCETQELILKVDNIYLKYIGVFAPKLVDFKVFLVPVLLTADDRLVQKERILIRNTMSVRRVLSVLYCLYISIMIH